IQVEHSGRFTSGPGHDPANDLRTDLIELIIDASHDAEVPPATAQSPEEVRVFVAARTHDPRIGGYGHPTQTRTPRPAPHPRVQPQRRVKYPKPPPRVSPAMPVSEMKPRTAASPCI